MDPGPLPVPLGGSARQARAWAVVVASALIALLLGVWPGAAHAQLFFASRPQPGFTIGPLMIRAAVAGGDGPVPLSVLWSVDTAGIPAAETAQDLYLLWPGEARPSTAGPPDPALARYVTERGFAVVGEGRLTLSAQALAGGSAPEPVPGGAPFVVFVQEGGDARGLSPPATLVRLPWTERTADPRWLMDLQIESHGLVKPKAATWVERLFLGRRYLATVSFNEVRERPLFPMYLHHRDRVVRLSDAPAELAMSFAYSDRLKIDQVFPPTSIRRLSETQVQTEVVSVFLDSGDGVAPQYLAVEFGYFSRTQAWAIVLVPALFFVLGHAIGPVLGRAALRVGDTVAARVRLTGWRGGLRQRESGIIVPRETLARLQPGRTTREDLVRLCGPPTEELEQLPERDARTLVYRGRRVAPAARRVFGWFATVAHWEVERHEVRVRLVNDVVTDVQAETRYSRHGAAEGAPGAQ
jgi:hypothetical protein